MNASTIDTTTITTLDGIRVTTRIGESPGGTPRELTKTFEKDGYVATVFYHYGEDPFRPTFVELMRNQGLAAWSTTKMTNVCRFGNPEEKVSVTYARNNAEERARAYVTTGNPNS